MGRYFRFIVFFFFNFFVFVCNGQKAEKAKYYGGHGCVASSLVLYTDSTYEFKTSTALLFPHTSRINGKYTLSDSSITLYEHKKFHFLILSYKSKKKYTATTFRIRDNDILMYTEKDELSENSKMIKDYNTMRFYNNSKAKN